MINMIPTSVDCIIIGTGLTNSIVAAACSRIGKTVLHIDRNPYYGDDWSSFTFQQLIDWIRDKNPQDQCLIDIPEDVMSKSRMFSIDRCPRLLYSNGPLVDLLVKSNVSRYHEFKNNVRILSFVSDDIHVMPCKRSEVFTSSLISNLVDKRRLMKFVETCVKHDQEAGGSDEIAENADKPICDYLADKKLTPFLQEFIINSIAMVDPNERTQAACLKIKNFMIATERFGSSPFIFPLYGCGEFPQSFCRLSAVFGGVYCLNTNVKSVRQDPQLKAQRTQEEPQQTSKRKQNFVIKLMNSEQEVHSEMLVLDHATAIDLDLSKNESSLRLSRGILITKESVAEPNKDNMLSFLRIPASSSRANIVFMLELTSSVLVSPPGYNVVHFWTKASSAKPEADLEPTVNLLYKDRKDCIAWKYYYQQTSCDGSYTSAESQEDCKIHVTSPPCNDIDYDFCIREAETIFKSLCPDEEFLPRAPDPDEIISV